MYAHIGQENYINADHVFAIVRNRGATPKKLRDLAEKEGRLYNLSGGEATRALIVMHNGIVFTSCITARTLRDRLNTPLHEALLTGRDAVEARMGDENGDNDEYHLDDGYAPLSEEDDDERIDDG